MRPSDGRRVVFLAKKTLSVLVKGQSSQSNSKAIGKDKPAPYGQREANIQATSPDPQITGASVVPAPPIPESRKTITCKVEKDRWDKFKPILEIAGVLVLGVYTFFTIKMYCANTIGRAECR